jgi:hypothetical protein
MGGRSTWADHRPNNEVLVGGAISQPDRYAEPAGRQVNSIRLWVDEVNARGGLLGHQIVLRLLDDKSDTQTAIKLYEKLITEDRVELLLAPYSSGITEAVANVNERYKMPFVAYGAASTPIWEKGGATSSTSWPSPRTTRGNLALGDRRTRAAIDYLVAYGVRADRLSGCSYGEERPTCTDRNETCRARHRRVHFRVQER